MCIFLPRYQFTTVIQHFLPRYRSDEGLTLETSALESLYGGQFTLSTPLILPKFLCTTPHRRSTTVSLETTPFIHLLFIRCDH